MTASTKWNRAPRLDPFGSGWLKASQVYLLAIVATAITLWVRITLNSSLGSQPTLVIFTLPILLAAYVGGLRAGLLATVLSCLAAKYYFFEPIHSFAITSTVACWQEFFLVLAGIVISMVNEALHRARWRADLAASQHRLAETVVHTSEARLRMVTDNARVGLVMVDRERRYTFANSTYAGILGLPSSDLVGHSVAEVLPALYQTQIRPYLDRAFDGERVEYELRRATSDEILYHIVRYEPTIVDGSVSQVVVVITDITQRKRAEESVRVSESRYRALFEYAPDGIVIADRESYYIDANASICRMLGYARDELIGLHASDIVIQAEIAHVEPALHAIKGKSDYHREWQFRRKNGSVFAAEVIATMMPDGNLLGMIRDITERKRIEAAAARLAAIVEYSDDAIISKDLSGIVTSWNAGAEKIFAYSAAQMIGQPIARLIPPERQREEADILERIRRGENVPHFDTVRLRRDGGAIDVSVTVSAMRDSHGIIHGASKVARDITDRKQAEKALRESERRFSNMMGDVQLASVMLDREARITYCNGYLLRLTGWSYEDVIGRNWFELFIPSQHRGGEDFFAKLLEGVPDTWHRENEILTRTGEPRLMRWHNLVLRSPGGDAIGSASIGEDVTERKQAEIKIRQLNRVHAMLSGINTLIVRVRDRDELFSEACRIAVDAGGFRMTWIGVVDRSSSKIFPIASAGVADELLTAIKHLLSSGERAAESMAARAIRAKAVIVSNDSQTDSKLLLGKESAESGVRSIAVFPLIVAEEAVGVFALYSEEKEFFHAKELELLTELSGDIAFAIDHIEKQERLDYLAYYDALTGLANRNLFLERVAQHMLNATRGGHKLAIALLDLERFKNINDSIGQPGGDVLLKQVADWLTSAMGDASRLARIDADHFAMVMPEVRQEGDVARLIQNRRQAFLDHPFQVNDSVFRVTAKLGLALFPADGTDAATLFRHAEAALKKAKASGERYLFYTQQMTESVAGKISLENQLRQALEKDEFLLHYQPKVNLATSKLTGAEALIRWNDPKTGLVAPARFIPVLEETGLIHDVGRWALRKAVEDYLRWCAVGLAAVRIAVNVSPLQLRNRDFIDEVKQAIDNDAQASAGLELEITESLIMENVKHSITSLQAIRVMGVTIAIDDFGTGFSSLSYLAKLPVDTLKIDRSFVVDMTTGPEGLALVSTIIKLAHSLRLKVVAEGVETEEQSNLLRLLACDEMQGYLFSKPLPSAIFEARYLSLANS